MKKKIKTIPDKIGRRYFKVYDPIFKRRIHILLGHTPQQYTNWLNKQKIKDIDVKAFDEFTGFSTAIEQDGKPTDYLVYMKNFDWTLDNMNTLIHEIVHTVFKIFQSNNIPFNIDTQEFIAHSIGNIYEDVGRKLLVIKK